jgi:hypothetical protein
VEGASRLMLLPPERAERWQEMLASAEKREQLAQDMRATTAGVVMQSKVMVDDSGAVVATEESMKTPPTSANMITAEIVDQAKIDDRRMQFSLRLVRGGETNLEYLTFGLTGTGWKSIE